MRRSRSQLDISMFPFLSVLCTVIGVLMLLLLLVISTRTIKAAKHDSQIRPGDGKTPGLPLADQEALRADLRALGVRVDASQAELSKLLAQRDRLKEFLALQRDRLRLQKGSGILTDAGLNPEEKVDFAARNSGKPPRFIEASLDGFIVHPEKTFYPRNELPAPQDTFDFTAKPSSPMQELLAKYYDQRDRISLIILVRENGVKSHDRLHGYLCRKYPHPESSMLSQIDLGWEPFSDRWVLTSAKLKQQKE
jgi:hypothetical protein